MSHADGFRKNSLKADLAHHWPSILKKGKIRQLLTHRIVGLTSNLAHKLKQWIESVESLPENHPLSLDSTQDDLTSFSRGSTSPPGADKKDQKSGSIQPDQDGGDADDGGDDSPDPTQQDDREVGIIYARVSSDSQTENKEDDEDDNGEPDAGSIKGQISELEDIAEQEGIALPYEAFTDEAQTGTNFDREEIQRVFEVSKQKDIDYLLVEKIDRIGRNAPETLYFISMLQQECGVTLITPKGKQDIQEVKGLMHTTLMSLMAEVQNTIRTEKATKERIRGFLEKKNWNCKSPKVPLGYSEDDDGWLEVDPEAKEMVRAIFEKFIECENYSATADHVEEEFGPQALEGHSVKTILQESTYIGRPRLPEEWLDGMPFENDLHEPELHLLRAGDDDRAVSEETFEEVQAVIAEKSNTSSTDEETYTIEDFIAEFGLFATVESSVPVKLIHYCGEPLVKDGQVDIGGKFNISTHRYKCPACEEEEDLEDYYRKWPLTIEAEKMELLERILDEDSHFGASDEESNSDETTESDDN